MVGWGCVESQLFVGIESLVYLKYGQFRETCRTFHGFFFLLFSWWSSATNTKVRHKTSTSVDF